MCGSSHGMDLVCLECSVSALEGLTLWDMDIMMNILKQTITWYGLRDLIIDVGFFCLLDTEMLYDVKMVWCQ